MKWFILIIGIACNASASVLIKMAMMPPRKLPSLTAPFELFYNWPLLLGVALYGAAFILYAAALAVLPLNIAHPILTTGAVAVVAILSVVVFNESFYWTSILGVILVILGVFLITLRVSN
ncbi:MULTISPECIES: DMT family transporter [Citrobacter]|uniref:EamA family transporter n=1 Tax=Citrobacter freundii TaxID=546 RepID=A0AAD2SJ42_CITFR|nr:MULTISPECIES: EamA family transporter [Citrobacter]EJG2170028.1 EamA family transporter [Citrobacter freundii 47N]AXZ48843.1 multidrug transporter [Citrobacter freundii]EIJ9081495.1 EamA family transporter [Citrobacter freundii]EJH9546961.1 EamA family transporter [Citrobacter freundii]EJO6484491.1 EamA family transporter [Citrobacter freundii]